MIPSTKTPDIKRAVIYARYSCAGQSEQSIEGQLRDNYAFAERQNLIVLANISTVPSQVQATTAPNFNA